MSEILEIKGVNKKFGGVVANKNLSLKVTKGKIVGLIGPNGSGKTTLFSSIAGAIPIDSGSIFYNGEEISHLRVQEIARRGLVRTFQRTRVFAKMDCIQNVLVSMPHNQGSFHHNMFKVFTDKDRSKALEFLDFFGLTSKSKMLAGNLSFGQQKLLELAMVLVSEPQVLLLDEPTAGINPTLINGLIERLTVINKELGVTLFVIEHNMRVIMNLAEHIYCLAHGELLAEGSPEEMQNNERVIAAYLGAT